MATVADPISNISKPDLHTLILSNNAFPIPKQRNSTMPITITGTSCWSVIFIIPAVIMQGIKGITPKTMKEINVVNPHFIAELSLTTNPNYSSIMTFTKAWLLVAQSQEIRSDCSGVYPFPQQISMIYCLSASFLVSTSSCSRFSSAKINYCQAFTERQSPRPIPIASPKIAETAIVRI